MTSEVVITSGVVLDMVSQGRTVAKDEQISTRWLNRRATKIKPPFWAVSVRKY